MLTSFSFNNHHGYISLTTTIKNIVFIRFINQKYEMKRGQIKQNISNVIGVEFELEKNNPLLA